jgi:hypothetical protein
MITRDNFKDCINQLSNDDKQKIKNTDTEYTEIHCSSYGHIWVNSFTNDLPENYDDIISDGTIYFLYTNELLNILNKGK